MCVLFKLLKSQWVPRPTKLPPNRVMAAAVSVSTAARDESTDTGLSFVSRPLHENYDLGADHENWMPGDRRHAELEPGEEDSTSERECQRRVDEDLTSLSPEEIESRLERTRREFYNRRKIIIKNLPSDVSNQVWLRTTSQLVVYIVGWLIDWLVRLANPSLAPLCLPCNLYASLLAI